MPCVSGIGKEKMEGETMIPSSRIIDDAREKIAREVASIRGLLPWDTLPDRKVEKQFNRYLVNGFASKEGCFEYADQILAISGTTDIECPICKGEGYFPNDDTGEPNPPVGGIRCPAWCDDGSIPHKWMVSVVLENGEIPEPDILMYTHSNPSTYFISLQTQKSMLNAGYVQKVGE